LQSSKNNSNMGIPHKTGQDFGFLVEIQILGEDGEIFQAVNNE